ncbi:hypothetical protein MCHI_001563 [Candidatus Magnetoovum chiemensis]|nr:hypothetical protein MCHI_001563 [Candidatus Magnetoovum chiemensis]
MITAETVCAAKSIVGKRTAIVFTASGRGISFKTAFVITARVPSEPTIRRVRS